MKKSDFSYFNETFSDLFNDYLYSEDNSILIEYLEKNTNGYTYNSERDLVWAINVKGKGRIDYEYLEKLYKREGMDIEDYAEDIDMYLADFIYDVILGDINTNTEHKWNDNYKFEVYGKSGGHWGIPFDNIRIYTSLPSDLVETMYEKYIHQDDYDDWDNMDDVFDDIIENYKDKIIIDDDGFADRFNSVEKSIAKDNEYMKSEEFADELFNIINEIE